MRARNCRSCCRSWPGLARARPAARGGRPRRSVSHDGEQRLPSRGVLAAVAVAGKRPAAAGRARRRGGAPARVCGLHAGARAPAPAVSGVDRTGARELCAWTVVPQADGSHRRSYAGKSARPAAGRPPGLACGASFVLAVGLAAFAPTAYRWSQWRYTTHTTSAHATPGVLHVAFERSLPVGELEEMLRSAGARVGEGPGTSGIFGIAQVTTTARGSAPSGEVSPQMRALA